MDVASKQKPDRFPLLETTSMPLLLSSMSGQPQDILYEEWYRFLSVHKHSNCNTHGIFFIYELHVRNSKVKR